MVTTPRIMLPCVYLKKWIGTLCRWLIPMATFTHTNGYHYYSSAFRIQINLKRIVSHCNYHHRLSSFLRRDFGERM